MVLRNQHMKNTIHTKSVWNKIKYSLLSRTWFAAIKILSLKSKQNYANVLVYCVFDEAQINMKNIFKWMLEKQNAWKYDVIAFGCCMVWQSLDPGENAGKFMFTSIDTKISIQIKLEST